MPYKSCPNCNQTSYSASDVGVWYCPYCGNDITFVKGLNFQPERNIKAKEADNLDSTNNIVNCLRILPR